MGSEADAEAARASGVDLDGSVSWEDFFGTSTDLVPQLLCMFDELARRSDGYAEHMVLPSSCGISAVLQKHLNLVPIAHRNSIFDQLYNTDNRSKAMREEDLKNNEQNEHDAVMEITDNKDKLGTYVSAGLPKDRPSYQEENNDLVPLRYNKRCRNAGRPSSGSSIASSTSSSSCSNQDNACCAVNPYLASVESLTDTCISYQGSADSGIVTVSETSCQILNDDNSQTRNSALKDSSFHGPSETNLRYCDPHRNPVERVLLEIVDTEAIYVEHLRQVIQGYLIFWRDDPTSFIHQFGLGGLFSNIEDIFQFNREFLREIEKCGLDPVCVANTFIKHNSGFKVYTEYCTNYPRTVSILTDLIVQEETASAFRERQIALGHSLPLGSFLLKPVQRILKYHLLLENLSKEYDADCNSGENKTEGRNAIKAALATMTGIAKHINAMKRRHEHAVRVQEIQSLLYGWLGPDLTTSGELIAEGRFRIRGAKAPRHAFLFDRMFLLTKKKEDGLLVYKDHIMCSNIMLIETIPGESLSFHVIPFDNPRLQYTLQARNLEQKREWTLQIKRVILENYNAVIPSHARQLVLQLGQTQQEDNVLVDKGSAKKHSAPPEYLEKRKQERERSRSETGIRQKFKKGIRRSDTTIEDSPARKNGNENISNVSKEHVLNRSLNGHTAKVKVQDRFTGWRRKSEPGFQSYVCFDHSDRKQYEETSDIRSTTTETEGTTYTEGFEIALNSQLPESKDNSEQHTTSVQTMEEIVGHILMQNQEFQKLLEKQRTNNILNIRKQCFNKRISADTSDESDSENANYITNPTNHDDDNNNNRLNHARGMHRDHHLIRTNNAWNALTSAPQQNQPLYFLHDNLKIANKSIESIARNKMNHMHDKRALFEAFKRQNIVTESKVIRTALRMRENTTSSNEKIVPSSAICDTTPRVQQNEINPVRNGENRKVNDARCSGPKKFGYYDNLQHIWKDLQTEKIDDENDSPTRSVVCFTKLCEGLPTSPPKCGSLHPSSQISPNSQPSVTKSRFLQRDGKPMSERPFTIASDKPAEISLENVQRYISMRQPEGRIAKFPMPTSNSSSSTFFCSLENASTNIYSDVHQSATNADIHPNHKIYRSNDSSIAILRNVLSKAGSRLQGLRNTMSTETLECSGEFERTRYFRSLGVGKSKRRTGKLKHARESSSDMEELMSCASGGVLDSRVPLLYYKQGSSGLGARIAQSDYADPTILFAESKRGQPSSVNTTESKKTDTKEGKLKDVKDMECQENETDGFYERSFEIIENYADINVDEPFRDSAIFSDLDEISVMRQPTTTTVKMKAVPPIPTKPKQGTFLMSKCKPSITRKPDYLKSVFVRQDNLVEKTSKRNMSYQPQDCLRDSCIQTTETDRDDVSAGQSQVGWVRKIVSQLQSHIET